MQLLCLLPAFEGCDVAYVTVNEAYRSQVEGASTWCLMPRGGTS